MLCDNDIWDMYDNPVNISHLNMSNKLAKYFT